jgi:hypothetical protein
MKKFKLFDICIVVLLIVILLQRCGKNTGEIPSSTHDTTTKISYIYLKDTGRSVPIYIKGGRDTVLENTIEYIPSQDYDSLYIQFQNLKQDLLSKNIYKDSISVDTIGYVKITDTLQLNKISGRGFTSHLKIPEKTITITNTIYPKPTRQLYVGGGIYTSQSNVIDQIQMSLLLKNKKDQMFGISGGMDLKGEWMIGVESYWKIKLKK